MEVKIKWLHPDAVIPKSQSMENLCEFEHNGKRYVALVRKLTERECYRLMGNEEQSIDTMLDTPIARTAHYKLAGNSIVVDVLYHIFRKLFIEPGSEKQQMSIFDVADDAVDVPHYDHDNPLRVVTLCSGYDSQCLAFERLKRDFPPFDYELVAWSEFDPVSKAPLDRQPAVVAHKALFPQWADRNLGDMTKIDWEQVPDFDMLFYSTPCQSISQAGLQHGFTEGSGTRSSIIWNVRDALRIKKPKYACLENVANMVSEKFMPMFRLWQSEVQSLGYENHARLLNAKHYGVPQNRDRIFLLSMRDDVARNYNWPEPMPLHHTLPEMLDEVVDTKYYLDPVKVNKFINDNLAMIEKYMDESDEPIEPLPEHLMEWLEKAREKDE